MSAPVKHLGIVVVAVDGSPASDAATCWAARNAALRNVPLTVVSVVTTPTATFPPVPYPDSLGVRLEDQGRKVAADAVKIAEDAMPTDRKVAVKSEVVFSTPAQALVKMSDEAEMIVVGSSGKGTLARGPARFGQFERGAASQLSGRGHPRRRSFDPGSATRSRPGGNRRLARL